MERCQSVVRWWKPDKPGGLAVADLPPEVAAALGGLRQRRVTGAINGQPYVSSVMPAGGGVLCLSVSRAMLKAAGPAIGDALEVEVGLA